MKKTKGKQRFMALKMDMEKAYDRMEWSFLLQVNKCLGFCDQWISWIKECISTTSVSMLVNGTPQGFFFPSRGLRQGDPLSPFLFILGDEVLSKVLHRVEDEGKFRGFQLVSTCLRVSHLLFANNLIIFSRANEEDSKEIQVCIEQYQLCSGQLVNWKEICYRVRSESSERHPKILEPSN